MLCACDFIDSTSSIEYASNNLGEYFVSNALTIFSYSCLTKDFKALSFSMIEESK